MFLRAPTMKICTCLPLRVCYKLALCWFAEIVFWSQIILLIFAFLQQNLEMNTGLTPHLRQQLSKDSYFMSDKINDSS